MSALLLRLEKVTPGVILLLLDGICGHCRIRVEAVFSKDQESVSAVLAGNHNSLPQLKKTVIALMASTEDQALTFNLRLFDASVQQMPDEASEIQYPGISESEWNEKSALEKQVIVFASIKEQMACNGKVLANMLGISTSHMCNLLLGKRSITWRIIHKLHSDFPLSQKMKEAIRDLVK